MKEEWREVEGFPNYLISSHGNLYNMKRRLILATGVNQQGIATVSLSRNGVQHMRSISILVANAFVEKLIPAFNTPINLDGDRLNNVVENLAWRSRPFAIRFHRQFSYGSFYEILVDTELIETGEKFEDLRQPCMQYGMIYTHVIRSYVNGEPVFPMGYHFRLL